MKWLLIAFVFNGSATVGSQPPKFIYKAFPTEQACNTAGEHFREVLGLPEVAESVSVCIDKGAFNATDWKLLATPEKNPAPTFG